MSKRLAICVGVDTYKNKPSANLRFARKDAESVALLLRDNAYGGFEQVIEIYDDKAEKKSLTNSLKDIFLDSNLDSDDLILFFYSGHGSVDNGDNLFLAPHDIDFLSDGSIDVTSTLHIKDLELLIDNCKAGNILVLLDACHSGASTKLLGKIKYKDSSNIILVGAARYSEKAWETPELSHGRFTESLLRSVNLAPSQGEWITLQQSISSTQLEMQKMSPNQMIEASSHAINQNILFLKNPLYTLESEDFFNQVKNLCEISNCSIVPTQPGQTHPNTFIMQEPRTFGRYDNTIVFCLDNSKINLTEANIEHLNVIFHSLQTDGLVANGMMIVQNEVPVQLTNRLNRLVVVQTLKEMQRNLINFDRYLKQLISDFRQGDTDRIGEPPLAGYYVELNAQKKYSSEEIEKLAKETFGSKFSKDEIESIQGLLGGIYQRNAKNYINAERRLLEIEDTIHLNLEPKTTSNKSKAIKTKKPKTDISALSSAKDTKKVLDLFSFITKSENVSDIVTQWKEEKNERVAIILGGYGTGKTSFARKLACELAERYLASSDKSGLRIPILFHLRRFPKFSSVDIEGAVIAHLKQQCMVINPDFSAFKAMHKAGLFLLIFDGFDEMAVQANEEIIKRNFIEIMQFSLEENAKILITSRPEAFISEKEEVEVLEQKESHLVGSFPRIRRINLIHLSQTQVELYLQKRIPLIDKAVISGKDWKFYLDQINKIMGLKELTQRPVLLDMTIKTLPKLIDEGGQVTRPRLYETYLSGEIIRQQRLKKRDFLIEKEKRMYMIQMVANYLYSEKRVELSLDQIQNVLQSEFTSEQKLSMESYIRDFIACSFLTRENDLYRFSHLSFMEYLVAKSLANEISTNSPDIFKKLALTPAVRDFLVELAPRPRRNWSQKLWGWIEHTIERSSDEVFFLGGNSLTLLNYLGVSLKGKNFDNAKLNSVNLQSANLIGSSFVSSDLRSANFEKSNLVDVNFKNANLTNANLSNTIYQGNEPLSGDELKTHIKNSRFFSGANLEGIQYTSSLTFMERVNEIMKSFQKIDFKIPGIKLESLLSGEITK